MACISLRLLSSIACEDRDSLQVLIYSDFDANRVVPSKPILDAPDEVAHLFRLTQKVGTDPKLEVRGLVKLTTPLFGTRRAHSS